MKTQPYFNHSADMTESEVRIHHLREKLYQLAVHYVLRKKTDKVTPSFIQRLSVPFPEGTRLGAGYEACQHIFERMVTDGILQKIDKNANHLYKVIRKRAPFSLTPDLKKELRIFLKNDEKRVEPIKHYTNALQKWLKELTGCQTLEKPFRLKLICYENNAYTQQLWKGQECIGIKTFCIDELMNPKKNAS